MASFYSLLSFMAVNGFEYSDPRSFDVISRLPLEMAITILRMLPGKDLLNAACVNKKWLNICKSDSKLRQKIRRSLRQQRRAGIAARLFGSRRRDGFSDVPNRLAMTNVVNTSNFYKNRLNTDPTGSRYMPYRREANFGTQSISSSRRRTRTVEENNSSRFRLRM